MKTRSGFKHCGQIPHRKKSLFHSLPLVTSPPRISGWPFLPYFLRGKNDRQGKVLVSHCTWDRQSSVWKITTGVSFWVVHRPYINAALADLRPGCWSSGRPRPRQECRSLLVGMMRLAGWSTLLIRQQGDRGNFKPSSYCTWHPVSQDHPQIKCSLALCNRTVTLAKSETWWRTWHRKSRETLSITAGSSRT